MKHSLLLTMGIVAAAMTSCNHKDLYEDLRYGSRIDVVFDWRYAPDAAPASMALFMYGDGSTTPVDFNFQNNSGGTIRIPFGNYTAVGFNNDNTDWAVIEGHDDIDQVKIKTTEATVLEAAGLYSRALPRSAESADEPVMQTPGMFWSDRIDNISLVVSNKRQTVTLYPEERVCHYTVDIYDIKNFDRLLNTRVDATISGMADGFHPGREKAGDNYVTMPFVLSPDSASGSLHSEFLTFGETPAAEKPHNLSMYLITSDGSKWHYSADVSSQVAQAPDPTHVHIVLRGIDIPDVGKPMTGGVIPDVNDWKTVNIDLKM